MSPVLEIPVNAAGRIDVFALDLPRDEVDAFMAQNASTEDPTAAWPLRAALGADYLDPQGVDLIALKDLEGVGLSGYLTEGLGAEEAGVAPKRATLDALTGHAVVLRGRAWGGMAQSLAPRAPLRHVGTFHEVAPEAPGPALRAESAEPGTDVAPEPASEDPAPAGRGSPAPLVLASLVLAAVLVAVLSLVLG